MVLGIVEKRLSDGLIWLADGSHGRGIKAVRAKLESEIFICSGLHSIA
jgi:hypothetical protein